MRTRGSLVGPLILIAIGVLFLVHTFAPNFHIGELLANFWPYLLILWGVVQLIEIGIRVMQGSAIGPSGIHAGSWVLVLFICIIGLANWEIRRPDTWWRRAGFDQSMEVFGDAHNYTFAAIQRNAGKSPRIVIERFRGDAKIVGGSGTTVTVSGRKVIRALDNAEADRANANTPVSVQVEGNTVVIRASQDSAGGHTQVATDLDISIPSGASVEATGRVGDFDVSSVSGDVDLTNENGELHLQDIDGNVKLDTHKSDVIRCANVKGRVLIRGRGGDVELSKVAGQVTVDGEFNGTLSLRELMGSVRVKSMRTELDVQSVPGEVTLARGSLEVHNVVGPLKVSARSTDVTLKGFSDSLDVTIDKGDIDLQPGRLPLSRIAVHAKSGNIELALPQKANFALSASTDRGEIQNQFGDVLNEQPHGHGSRLEGAIGSGPEINVSTDRGTITVRKSTASEDSTKASRLTNVGTRETRQILFAPPAVLPHANASL